MQGQAQTISPLALGSAKAWGPTAHAQTQAANRVSKSCGWFFKEQSPTLSLPSILSYFHKPSNGHHITKFGAREGKINTGKTAVSSNEASEAAFTVPDTGPDPFITQIPLQ